MMKWSKRLLYAALAIVMALSLAAYAETAEDSLIASDVIAGIDHGSITVEGESTFFTSVMSDGALVRFEGRNIAVSDDGITLNPGSAIISLDAIGKIYDYRISIQNGNEAPVSEQLLDIGYGYTNSAEKLSVESADNIYSDPLYAYPVAVWNDGVSLSIAEIMPNFVFVQGSHSNTVELTITNLIIGYDPSEKYTDIEFARKELPDHFINFEAFFENMDGISAETFEEVYEEPVEDDPLKTAMEDPAAIYSDVIAGIDRSSIKTEGESTFFTSVMSDGALVRFEGKNISISDEGLILNPESRVTSLDAVGSIYLYCATVKDGESEPVRNQWLSVGGGYTFDSEKTSVERASDVLANAITTCPALTWNDGTMISVLDYAPNFVFFNGQDANTIQITITSLTIGYTPTEVCTAIEDVHGYLPDYYYAQAGKVSTTEAAEASAVEAGVPVDSTDSQAQVSLEIPHEEEIDAYSFADRKMAESGAITSDVITGIDRSSIKTEGESTFFTSVMSDGTSVRFEGKNISISDEGILMNPGSSVTSLDAVGKIYEYCADVKDKDAAPISEQMLNIGYGYTFSADKTSVEHAENVYTYPLTGLFAADWNTDLRLSVAFYEPNFVFFRAQDYNTASFTLTSLTIGYNPNEKVTAITAAALDASRYGVYMEGEPYSSAKEDKADATAWEYDFYLLLKQETLEEAGIENSDTWLHFLPNTFYEVGDLKDADGNVLDKTTARIQPGCTLDVRIGDYTLTLNLPMADLYEGVQTLREARPYSTLNALGEQHALAIPVVWADQTDLVSEDAYALYQKALGNLIDAQGNPVDDFSDAQDNVFSLSEYFHTASYGQLELSTFLTDWYYTDKTFAGDYEYIFPEVEFADEVLQWVKANYPDMDWTQFDQDGDGVVDSIVLISVGLSQDEAYVPASFGGAVHSTGNNYGKRAGTQDDPQANCFLTVNHSFLMDGKTNALIHEFSHNFGLNDYYDGSGYGVNAVGGYDMEGDSVGDWNAYSKLIVGWMNPQIVSDLASGESVELTIASSALAGDVILLPAAGTQYEGPFSEYVMVDLLSPNGVNTYDAADYGLENTVGVRISHVNANLKRSTESDDAIGYVEDNGNVIGMELYSNNYDDDFGFYNIEVIQAGGENSFTDLEKLYPILRAEDLFYAGDSFAPEDYVQFFHEGRMDNGMALGYRVDILSIDTDAEGKPSATIRITAN